MNEKQIEKLCSLIIDRTNLEAMQRLCPGWCHIDQIIDTYLEQINYQIEKIDNA